MATETKRETAISFTWEEWLEIRVALLAKSEELYSSAMTDSARRYWQNKILAIYDKIDTITCQCMDCESRK